MSALAYTLEASDALTMFTALRIDFNGTDGRSWRIFGEIGCSNGASTCRATFPNRLGSKDRTENVVSSIIERIDANGDDIGDWVVFAGLGQELYYSGGAEVEWITGKHDPEDERILIPNIFRLDRCEILMPKEPLAGALFGIWPLCQSVALTGQRIPMDFSWKPYPDGLWWMDDKKLVGWEIECDITGRRNDKIMLSCEGEGSTWTEERPFVDKGDIRYVGNVTLARCDR